MKHFLLSTALLATLLALSCAPGAARAADAAPDAAERTERDADRAKIRKQANDILHRLYKMRPQSKDVIARAAGYGVFRNLGTKLMLVGGGSGKGIVIDQRTNKETFMRMAEIQAGLGFGAKRFDVIWVFQTRAALQDFLENGMEFGGQSTFAAKSGKHGSSRAGAVQVGEETWVYQLTEDGLAAELTLKGTKYYHDRKLND